MTSSRSRELVATRARIEVVVGWLNWRGVVAEALALPSKCEDVGQLTAIAKQQGADVVVAGT